jgi:hypothetical protein
MATKNSAAVMETRASGEVRIDYYVRSVSDNVKLFDNGASEIDAWAAYREEQVFVTIDGQRTQFTRVERISDAPRMSITLAVEDMWAAIKLHTDPDRKRDPARLIRRGDA